MALLDLVDDAGPGSAGDPDTLLGAHDAFSDNPIPFLIAELDERFPGARFVHTHRPVDDWLRSMRWLFGEGLDRLDPATRVLGDRVHRELYGIDTFDEATLRAVWHDHRATVAAHFVDRPDDVLHVETAELDWEPMCAFLGLRPPSTPFPHSNRAPRRRWRRG